MRHKVAGRRLNMPADQRKALLKGLVRNLIINEGIVTTEQKAKEARPIFEKLVTTAKKGYAGKSFDDMTADEKAKAVHARRLARKLLPAPKMPREVLAMKGEKQKEAKKAIRERDAMVKLFDSIAPKLSDKSSGYTRIVKVGFRRGDNASLVKLEIAFD
jgi:large subunit ribosomal protein L17